MKLLLLDVRGEPALIDIADVCMISPTRNGPEFVTPEGVFRLPQTTVQLCRLYAEFGFEQVDRGAIVNMNKAALFDSGERKVYFGERDKDGELLYATVSTANAGKVKHLARESGYQYGNYASAAVSSWFKALVRMKGTRHSCLAFKYNVI